MLTQADVVKKGRETGQYGGLSKGPRKLDNGEQGNFEELSLGQGRFKVKSGQTKLNLHQVAVRNSPADFVEPKVFF